MKYINTINKINKLRIKNNELNIKISKLSLTKEQSISIDFIKNNKATIVRNLEKIKTKTVLAERYLNAAMIELRKSVRANPEHQRAHFELGLIYLKKGTSEIDIATRSSCMKGDSLKEHIDKASSLLNMSKNFFLKSVQNKELSSESYNNVSAIYIYIHDYGKAIKFAKKALDNLAYEGAYVARTNLGWAYFFLNKYTDAISQFKQVLMFKNKYCVARYRLARVYFKQKNYNQAVREFEKTISQGPPCNAIQETYLYLGLAYLKINKPNKARNILEQCTLIAPNSCIGIQCKNNLDILVSGSLKSN